MFKKAIVVFRGERAGLRAACFCDDRQARQESTRTGTCTLPRPVPGLPRGTLREGQLPGEGRAQLEPLWLRGGGTQG